MIDLLFHLVAIAAWAFIAYELAWVAVRRVRRWQMDRDLAFWRRELRTSAARARDPKSQPGSALDAIFRDIAEVEVWKRAGRDRGVPLPSPLIHRKLPAELNDPDRR